MKRIISILLALVMMLGTVMVASAAESAQEIEDEPIVTANELHFDANSASWNNFRKVYCHIWEYGGDSFYAWQSRSEQCNDEDGDGVWTYDLDAKYITLEEGKLYGVIFANENGLQTYTLLFDSSVVGDTAYCKEGYYEHPEDDTKIARQTFWKNQDPEVFGPEMRITTTGNVVGTCIPYTTTAYEMFRDFLCDYLDYARRYSNKNDQKLFDDIGHALKLKKEEVVAAVEETDAFVKWRASESDLESESADVAEPDNAVEVESLPQLSQSESKICIDTKELSYADRITYVESLVTCYSVNRKVDCTDSGDGVYYIDLADTDVVPEEDEVYRVLFYIYLSHEDYGEGYTGPVPILIEYHEIFVNNTYLGYTAKLSDDNTVSWEGVTPDFVAGDVNGDSQVTVVDATLIQRLVAKSEQFSETQLKSADVNNDGEVTVIDATILQRFVAKIIDKL
ncbi:MAG: hypothetical protein IJE16_06630 [Ruminococcus sp.]|nr:hypothetical protein [Ruminococcus sp.]